MSVISRIGTLELFLVSLFAVLLIYRAQAVPESRVATALVFVFSARFGSSFINGFSISEATKMTFGQLDTIFAYLMLTFAFLEVLLIKRNTKWSKIDICSIGAIFGLGLLNLVWKLAYGNGLSANDLIYSFVVLIFLLLHPTRADLRLLPFFGASIIFLVFVVALAKYQNPLFPYTQIDYGLGGPYQNRVWEVFGLEERFRGPYFHPNQLGIQITFLSALVLLRPTKFYLAVLPFSYTLLFLASSRTSLFALTLGFLVRVYFDSTKTITQNFESRKDDLPTVRSDAKLGLRKFFAGCVATSIAFFIARQIFENNSNGTGRLQNYASTISAIQENVLLGRGPSLYSINSTENTVLTILSYYGLSGFLSIVTIIVTLVVQYKSTNLGGRSMFLVVVAIFLFAGFGETLLTGSSVDTGLYYFLVLLSLTRR